MNKISVTFFIFFITHYTNTCTLITLEGTTGAGKSTLLKIIEQELNEIQVVYEPVDQIQNVNGTGNLLDLYYHDNKRWTYTFQTYAYLLQDEVNTQAAQTTSKKFLLGDRSIYSTFYVFGKMLKETNVFSSLEWFIYKRWFNYAEARSTMRPKAFIYLRTTPDVCFLRIKKRNRCEEQEAHLHYYTQEYEFHEKWLINKEDIEHQNLLEAPILILDGNADFLSDQSIRTSIIQQIKDFIYSL